MFDIDENAIILKLDDVLREQYLTEQFVGSGIFATVLRTAKSNHKALTGTSFFEGGTRYHEKV